jgi:hypothetical protein
VTERTDQRTTKERLDAMANAIADIKAARAAPADPEFDMERARAMVASDDALRASVARAVDATIRGDGAKRDDAPRDGLLEAQDRHDWRSANAWRGEVWLEKNDPARRSDAGGESSDPLIAAQDRVAEASRNAWKGTHQK